MAPFVFEDKLMQSDTIAAIATSLNDSGIAIIRISGDEAVKIVDNLFVNKKGEHNFASFLSHTIHYGFIEFSGQVIDEVMVSLMKGPNSFTREDVVEINCHGGVYVSKKILEAVLISGARLAEPGEFTKRAFLNGRIDLSKAEAVMDIIASGSEAGLKNSLKHLTGNLYDKLKKIREQILYQTAFIESALDDPEHISLDGFSESLLGICENINNQLSMLIKSFDKGKFIKEGINTVIVGKPNVGKSSLLNFLVGEDRAIVTEIAGTTRDTIEERVLFGDVFLNLVDTAGIRFTDDVVENIGVSKAKNAAGSADLILFLLDSTSEITNEDFEIFEIIKEKNYLILLNKIDQSSVTTKEVIISKLGTDRIIEISAKEGLGFEELENKVNEMFMLGQLVSDDQLVITNIRQVEELKSCREYISHVIDSINLSLPEDFYSIDLLGAYSSLGRIIGEDVDDDLVDEIFSKFCMGK